MDIYALVNDGGINITSQHEGVLRDMAQGQQVVTMVQAATDEERTLYAMVAYVANNPECSAVEVSMDFNVSLGTAIKMLARLENARLVKSAIVVGEFRKQVRRYRRAE